MGWSTRTSAWPGPVVPVGDRGAEEVRGASVMGEGA